MLLWSLLLDLKMSLRKLFNGKINLFITLQHFEYFKRLKEGTVVIANDTPLLQIWLFKNKILLKNNSKKLNTSKTSKKLSKMFTLEHDALLLGHSEKDCKGQ